MKLYKICWKTSASKELRKLPKSDILKILRLIEELSLNPLPAGVKKLIGSEFTYRVRSGNYRIIYNIIEDILIIEIIRVRHRKDAYR